MAETGSPVIFASCRSASPFPASGCSPIRRAMEQSKATGADQRPWRDTGVGRSVATSSGLGGGSGCRPGRLFAVRPDGAQHPDQAGFGWTPVTLCVRLGYPSANFRRFSGGLPGIGLS
jgi:hypothetical protein